MERVLIVLFAFTTVGFGINVPSGCEDDPTKFQCGDNNQTCVERTLLCDGTEDCPSTFKVFPNLKPFGIYVNFRWTRRRRRFLPRFGVLAILLRIRLRGSNLKTILYSSQSNLRWNFRLSWWFWRRNGILHGIQQNLPLRSVRVLAELLQRDQVHQYHRDLWWKIELLLRRGRERGAVPGSRLSTGICSMWWRVTNHWHWWHWIWIWSMICRTRCVKRSNVCDGTSHCVDDWDESMETCDSMACLDTEWRCANRTMFGPLCIPLEKNCNGFGDCREWEDEEPENCVPRTCVGEEVGCPNRGNYTDEGGPYCINKYTMLCDGESHCPGDTDELPDLCYQMECPFENQVRCPTKTLDSRMCIFNHDLCDDTEHCANATDESIETCNSVQCKENEFHCLNRTSGRVCISKREMCDGRFDCRDCQQK